MNTPDWNNLILPEDWAEELQRILAAAKEAIFEGDAARAAIIEVLQTFVEKSPFNAGKLDDIATNAVISLDIATIADALAAIEARNDELKVQLALLKATTHQAEANVKKLRLDRVNIALANAETALKALQKANNAVGNPDAELTTKIDAIVQAIDELA